MNGADFETARHAFQEEGASEYGADKDNAEACVGQSDGNSSASDDFNQDDPLHGLVERTKTDPAHLLRLKPSSH